MSSIPQKMLYQGLDVENVDSDNSTGIVITTSDPLVKSLVPILSRVRTDVFWQVKNGGAPICPGTSVTRVGLLDFDSHKGKTSWADMKLVVMKVINILQSSGGSPIPFRSSGGKGVHLYLLWDTQYSVRSFLRETLQSAGLVDGTKGVAYKEVEIFPKQNTVAEGDFGNMFILPLAGKSVPLDAANLEDIDRANVHKINWLVSTDVPVVTPPLQLVKNSPSSGESLRKLKSALDVIPYKDTDQFGYQQFLKFVFAIHHESGGSAEGLELTHSFFSRADEYDGEEIDKLWANTGAKKELQGTHPVTAATIYHEARLHGWVEPIKNDFEDLTKPQELDIQSLPLFILNKGGEIRLTMDNMVKAIGCRDLCGMDVGYDTFRDEIMYSIDDGTNWMPFKDADYTRLRINLERKDFKSSTKEMTRDAVLLVAESNRFDSAQLWLNMLEWDGVKRVDSFMPAYIGTEDTPYHRAVGRYLLTALAGRVLSPGCKADMAPVLVGKQGIRKSSAVAALSPDPMYFVEISFGEKDDDLSRKMRGRLIAEIAELKGLHSRDSEHVKAWITKQHEDWIPKYREFSTIFPRRLIFVGTTNNEEFLGDETGNRRWLPVRVNKVIDVDRITRDRIQLWAEAREMFKVNGIDYKEVENLAVQVHAEHMISDPWEPDVADWLDKGEAPAYIKPSKREYLQTHEVLQGALKMEAKNCGRLEQMRIGRILQKLGFERRRKRVKGRPSWVFVVPTIPTKARFQERMESP